MPDATVQLLTAEVRTLMVGSRQVTLSVYKQLDVVQPNQIEPFGRVRIGAAEADGWRVRVVGRHRETGTLVASSAAGGKTWVTYRDEWATLPLIVLAGLR